MQTAMSKCHANCKLKIYNTYTHRQERKKKERNLGRIPASHLITKEQKMKKKKKKRQKQI